MNTVQMLLKDDVRLSSPPAIAVRIIDVVKHENFSFAELGAIIQSDPALAGRVLRLANSGFYALPRKVSSVETAIGVLGANSLKNIALSFILSQSFQGQRGEHFDYEKLWRRAMTSAVAGQLISQSIGFQSEETFITCLLQDIGVAALFLLKRDEYLAVLDEKAVTGQSVIEVEKRVFGFDHQEVGGELLKMWGLPESVYLPILYHHAPESAPPEHAALCNLVHASDRLAAVYHGVGAAKNVRKAKSLLSETFELDDTMVSALIDSVADKSRELLSQFDIEPGRMLPFSQILQEANDELSRLNLSYEMLVMEHKDAKQRAERLAVELRVANEKLRHVAFRDGLTGLFNHRYFQEAVDRELSRAKRHGHALALIMLDLDHFKSINDTYGHQRGDVILKSVAQKITSATRSSDLVARYGGEEFAIILPETNLAGALAKAEACRAMIEAMEIAGEGLVRMTVSVGVATYDPEEPITRDSLIEGADQAMYRSKRNGRNRVTIWEWRDEGQRAISPAK